MWLIKMAWLNLWRNRMRTLVSMAAVFFAVVLSITLTCLQNGAFEHLVENLVGYYSGYIQVHAAGYQNEPSLENGFRRSLHDEKKILAIANIASLTPRLESFALAASHDITKGVMVVGIDPKKENNCTALQKKLVLGNFLRAESKDVLIGSGLLRRLKLQVNDTLILIGQGYHGSTAAGKYRIGGVLRFGSPMLNDQVLFMPLTLAQELFSAEELITSYVLMLTKNDHPDAAAIHLRAMMGKQFEVLTWEEMMPDIRQHINSDRISTGIFRMILYFLVGMGIFGTMLMMMVERKKELGMLLAIGMSKSKLSLLLALESLLTVMGGCFIGLVFSVPLVYYLHIHPIRFSGELGSSWERFGFEAVIPASLNPDYFIRQVFAVLCIGLLISAYPVWKVIRMQVVQTLKS